MNLGRDYYRRLDRLLALKARPRLIVSGSQAHSHRGDVRHRARKMGLTMKQFRKKAKVWRREAKRPQPPIHFIQEY